MVLREIDGECRIGSGRDFLCLFGIDGDSREIDLEPADLN